MYYLFNVQEMSLFKCEWYNGMDFPEGLGHLSCFQVQLTIIFGLTYQ